MNNEATILFHKVQWFLNENDTKVLDENWEQFIRDFIYQGYKEGSFEVEFNNETDLLIWRIDGC